MARRPTLHIIPILRWRRGGHQSFRESQLSLVSIIDRLIDQSSHESICRGVLLDGQTLVLDDYLELRPDASGALTETIKSQEIDIGPWYVPPAEVLIHPEALVRNLLTGSLRASAFGSRLDVGVLPTSVGHTGQMPQILRGFGIDAAVVVDTGKYMAGWWQAPDASRVILIQARSINASELVEVAPSNSTAESVLLSFLPISGSDWSESLIETMGSLQKSNRSLNSVTGSLSSLFKSLERAKLGKIVEGGLSDATEDADGLLSSRIWQKQRNHSVESLMIRWAEPFGAWADHITHQVRAYDRGSHSILEYAWRTLLQNHAPEMIGGAHTDEVAQEIEMRFRTSEHIAQGIMKASIASLADAIDTNALSDHRGMSAVVVFNSNTSNNTDTVPMSLVIPADKSGIEIIRSDGRSLPYQVNAIGEADEAGNVSLDVTLSAEVSAIGYATYAIRQTNSPLPTVIRDDGREIENAFLSAIISPENGALTLYDKRTGRSFGDLNRFVDGGDAGDLYHFVLPQRDTQIEIATNTPLPIERQVGPVEQTLETFQIYRVPRSLTDTRDMRLPLAAQFVPISIWTTARLKRGVPRLDIEVMIANAALDHRLRVHFPTGVYADEAYLDAPFEVVKHAISDEPQVFAQRAFVTVFGGTTGLTVANRGLPEVELIRTDQGLEIALTLMRCVGQLDARSSAAVSDYATRDAQCIGDYSFAYSLIPHGDDVIPAWHQAWNFQSAMLSTIRPIQKGTLPASGSLVTIDNPSFVITSVKWANTGEGLIIRGYNLSKEPQDVSLTLGINALKAIRTRLDETPLGKPLTIAKQRLSFTAKPHEIVTHLIPLRV